MANTLPTITPTRDSASSMYSPKTRDPYGLYTAEMRRFWQARVLEHVANGRSVASFVRENADSPTTATIMRWAASDHEFGPLYHAALLCMGDALVDQIIDIADSRIDPKRAAVMIKARQYVASVLNPARYGQRVDVTSNGQHIAQPVDPDATPLMRVRAIVQRAKALKAEDAQEHPPGGVSAIEGHATPGEGEPRTWSILD